MNVEKRIDVSVDVSPSDMGLAIAAADAGEQAQFFEALLVGINTYSGPWAFQCCAITDLMCDDAKRMLRNRLETLLEYV